MSKIVLVELTEQEAETILSLMEIGWLNKPKENMLRADIEKISALSQSAHKKIVEGFIDMPDVLITAQDYNRIKDLSVGQFHNLRNDLYVSNKKMEERDSVHISLANAVIGWLNSKGLLKQVPRFDYTDHSSEYEEMEE
jgi:hypothetical protein